MFEKLFSPLQIGPLTIPNRIQVTPHELQYLDNGLVSNTMVDYYEQRAMGGTGLLEVSQLAIKPAGDWKQDSARRHPIQSIPEIVPGLKRLADAVHPHGSKIFMEVAQWTRVVGPVSSIPFETGVMLDELTQDDIREIQRSYRTAARYVKEAGFDGIDLHGTHGALIEHFYSPAMNRRTDRYGGTIEGRLTFLFELIEMLRSDLGDGMALGMRLCADERLEAGVTPEYAVKIVQLLDGRLDFINVDSGSSGRFEALNQFALQTQPLYVEKAYGLYMSEPIMKVAGRTKIGIAGRITDPVVAESIIESGRADYVGMTRALIADPELPRKAREGRLEEIRPCIGTLQDCWGRSVAHEWPMHCTVNPAVGFEGTRGQQARGEASGVRRKKVLIVGAGVAGLEAARASSERGHEVVVYEREAEVGGQVNLARLLPGRADVSAILPWYRTQLKKNGVRIETRKGIGSPEEARFIVEEERPDVVLIATGSAPIRTGIQMITFREITGMGGRQRQDHRPGAGRREALRARDRGGQHKVHPRPGRRGVSRPRRGPGDPGDTPSPPRPGPLLLQPADPRLQAAPRERRGDTPADLGEEHRRGRGGPLRDPDWKGVEGRRRRGRPEHGARARRRARLVLRGARARYEGDRGRQGGRRHHTRRDRGRIRSRQLRLSAPGQTSG